MEADDLTLDEVRERYIKPAAESIHEQAVTHLMSAGVSRYDAEIMFLENLSHWAIWAIQKDKVNAE